MTSPSRGFTLLIAVVLASVALSIGLALLDITYKQVTLSGAARQSQAAFYNADTAMECVLFHDQQLNTFAYSASSGSVTCGNQTVAVTFNQASNPRTRTFTLPCPAGGASVLATVTVYKEADAATAIYTEGYNTCDASNPRRIERGLKATY